jgi:ribosomal protein S18 acetylase RimI-like enzyme
MSNNFIFRKTRQTDQLQILDLYQTTAQISGGIIRTAAEVTPQYVAHFLGKSSENGLGFVCELPDDPLETQNAPLKTGNTVQRTPVERGGKIVAEIHAYVPPLFVFRHVLTELTVVVHPDFQGLGLGKRLFQLLLAAVKDERADILRVELFVRESNVAAIQLYKNLGFTVEGGLKDMILNADGSLETPLVMAWFNPSFQKG